MPMTKNAKPNTTMTLVSGAYATAKQAVDSLPSLRLPALIRKPEQQSLVVDMLRQVATARALTEAKRKSVTKHLDAAKKSVMSLFKPMLKHLDDTRVDLEKRLDEYSDWQYDQAEVERERLRKIMDAKRKRQEAAARKKLEAAETRVERQTINAKLSAKLDVDQANFDNQLAEVDDRPDVEEGVAVIEDVEVTTDMDKVPEFWLFGDERLRLWSREPLMTNLKKLGNADVKVPGVTFERKVRRAVKRL